ncbi:MAG: HEAT repeat domain-containing protein [bacterium]
MGKGSARDAIELGELLHQHGFGHVAQERDPHLFASVAQHTRMFRAMHEGWKRLLSIVSNLSTEDVSLTQAQQRRLDELADLVSTLRIPTSPAGWVASALHSDEAGVARTVELAAELSGLDHKVLAAEARLVIRSDDLGDGESFLMDFPHPREVEEWSQVPPDEAPRARSDLAHQVGGHPWLRVVAAHALAECPDHEGCFRNLDPIMQGAADPQARETAARLIAYQDPTAVDRFRSWRESSDPRIREVAAFALARLVGTETAADEDDIRSLLMDDDRMVRHQALEGLAGKSLPVPIKEIIARGRASPAPGWQCEHCGEENRGDGDSCSKCNIVATRLSPEAGALLSGEEPEKSQ